MRMKLPDSITCPTCGAASMVAVKRDFSGEFRGQCYIVPSLEFHECRNCGEQLFGVEAMRKIEKVSPAYAKRRKRAA